MAAPDPRTPTASSAAEIMIPVDRLSRALLGFLALGVGINFYWRYEWLCFRNTDLYSWAPSAQHSYRGEYGGVTYILPREDEDPWSHQHPIDGVLVENLPGIPIVPSSHDDNLVTALQNKQWNESNPRHQEMMQKLDLYRKDNNLSSMDDIPLTTKHLHLIYYVHQTDTAAALNWTAWLVGTKIPRVQVRAYENWPSAWRANVELLAPVRTRAYWNSYLYWLFMAVPIFFLVWDVRVPYYSPRRCREALFTPLPNLVLVILQWIVAPFLCLSCLCNSRELGPSHFMLRRLTTPVSVAVTAVDFLANALGQRRIPSSKADDATTSTTRLLSSAMCFYGSLVIRCGVVLTISFATYDWERRNDQRFLSCLNVYMCQVLMALILGQFLPRILVDTSTKTTPSTSTVVVSQNSMEPAAAAAFSGYIKFVASMTMYTAACTKIGESHGWSWIDDRYLAQLGLRGRYSFGAPFPLESWLLWSPPSLRALGMFTVLVMELVSVVSWWDFGRHYRWWIMFQIGSTLSIGVPIVPQVLAGPLWPVLEWVLEQCSTWKRLLITAAATITVLALIVAVVLAALGKTSMVSQWTSRRQGHEKRD